MRKLWRAAVLATSAVVVVGCGFWRPNVIPMTQSFYAAPCASADGKALPLLVLLPGRFMQPEEFNRNGYLQAVRENGMAVDVLIVDAHVGYYSDRTILDRLRIDVFEPARKRGVKDIWIGGISIGAFGAILYDHAHPGELAGLIAVGPYLGTDNISDVIRTAGGLRQWQGPAILPPLTVASSDADLDVILWHWLQEQTRSLASGELPSLYLTYGRDDRYHGAQELLADALPAEHVVIVDGDHDWNAWRPGWRQLLERLPIDRRVDCKVATDEHF